MRGLVANGAVTLVTTELARPRDHEAKRAEWAAAKWERIAENASTPREPRTRPRTKDRYVLRKAEE